jgi:NAD(P)-dependent dehydrogenase (short-subunit alcohol dehydrogenase family)
MSVLFANTWKCSTAANRINLKPLLVARHTGETARPHIPATIGTHDTTRPYSVFQKRLQDPVRSSSPSFAGKTVLVTGSNTGLGFEAALKFASLSAKHVILGVRNLEKGENARKSILQKVLPTSSSTDQKISVRRLDMNDYESIQTFVRQIGEEDGPLDVAILNAGVFRIRHETSSKYGWENDLQVNVLSTALLGLLLLQSRQIRPHSGVLEFVASRRLQAVQLTKEESNSHNLLEIVNQKHEPFIASRQYQVSKLLLVAFFRALAAKSSEISQDAPIITAICPGFCQSDLSRGHQGFAANMLRAILNTFVLRSAEEGARTLVSGAAGNRDRHGKFWFDDELHDV